MCGRYSDSRIPKHLRESKFPRAQTDLFFQARYNIAPTQQATVQLVENNFLVEKRMTWGFFPKWSSAPIINAQQETILEKPTFKNSFLSRRCLIRADGFYEWKRDGAKKIPMRFVLENEEPFYFAGLWDHFVKRKKAKGEQQDLFTPAPKEEPSEFDGCLILTTAANKVVTPIHNRMPVIVRPEFYDVWLDEDSAPEKLSGVLQTPRNHELKCYRVGELVNKVANETAECVQPVYGLIA